MAQTQSFVGTNASFSTASATRYMPFGDSSLQTSATFATYARAATTCRVAGTLSDLTVRVRTNARSTNTVFTTMKNGSTTSQAVTFGSGVTGTAQDTTDDVSLADGDTYGLQLVTGTGTGAILIEWASVVNTPSSGSAKYIETLAILTFSTASASTQMNVAGNLASLSEIQAHTVIPVAMTASNLQVYVVTNSRVTNSTVRTRVNAANGAQSVNITAGVTGLFEDTSNSDTLAAGDLFNYQWTNGTGSEILTLTRVGCKFTATGGFPCVTGATSSSSTFPHYQHVAGERGTSTTESQVQERFLFGSVASKLSAYVNSNPNTGTTTLKLRIDGVDGNNSVSFATGVTGAARDTTSSDTINIDDELSYSVTSTGTGAPVFSGIALFLAEAASGVVGGPMHSLHGFTANYGGQGFIDPGLHKIEVGI